MLELGDDRLSLEEGGYQLWLHHLGCPHPNPAGIAEHDPTVGQRSPLQQHLARAAQCARLVSLLCRPLPPGLLLGRRRWENTVLKAPLVSLWDGTVQGTWLCGLRLIWGLPMLELTLTRLEWTTDSRATQARGCADVVRPPPPPLLFASTTTAAHVASLHAWLTHIPQLSGLIQASAVHRRPSSPSPAAGNGTLAPASPWKARRQPRQLYLGSWRP